MANFYTYFRPTSFSNSGNGWYNDSYKPKNTSHSYDGSRSSYLQAGTRGNSDAAEMYWTTFANDTHTDTTLTIAGGLSDRNWFQASPANAIVTQYKFCVEDRGESEALWGDAPTFKYTVSMRGVSWSDSVTPGESFTIRNFSWKALRNSNYYNYDTIFNDTVANCLKDSKITHHIKDNHGIASSRTRVEVVEIGIVAKIQIPMRCNSVVNGSCSSTNYALTDYNTTKTFTIVPSTGYNAINPSYSCKIGSTGQLSSSTSGNNLIVTVSATQGIDFIVTLQPNTYTVVYNGNGNTGGSTASSSHTYNADKNLTANGFTRSHTVTFNYNEYGVANTVSTVTHGFGGWATSSSGSKVYDNKESVKNLTSTNNGTVNLYAKWNLKSTTLPTPTRAGYIFNGWYTAASGGTRIEGTSYTPTSNTTLYAQWTAISDINYENLFSLSNWLNSASSTLNGGSTNYNIECDNVNGSIKIIDKTGGSTDTYTPMSGSGIYTIPVTIGETYVFKCNIETNGTARPLVFATNSALDGWTTVLLDKSVGTGEYKWTFVPTTNYIHFRFGTVDTDNIYAKYSNIQVYKQSRYYLVERVSIKRQLTNLTSLQTLSKTGYTFNGWYDNENLTGSAVTLSWAQSRTTGTTIYSKWFDHRINFTYYGNNGQSTPFATWEAFISQGWPDNHYNYSSGDKKLTKTGYLPQEYIDLDGKKSIGSYIDDKGNTVGEDQIFDNYQELCNAHNVNISDQTASRSLYAQWKPIDYIIRFDSNTGIGTMSDLSMKYDQSKNLTACTFKKTGYTFQGWSRDKNATNKTYSDGESVSKLATEQGAEVILYAVWKANEYTVNYHGNENTGGSTKSSDHVYDVSKQLTENGFERIYHVTYNPNKGQCSINTNSAAYDFLGWKDSSGKEYSNKQTVVNLTAQKEGQFHLYAQWGSKSVTLPIATRIGYTFDGWYTSDNKLIGMNGVSYTPTASITLQAHWIEHKYTIEFYGNGETGGSLSSLTNIGYDEERKLSKNSFYKTGYHFSSWNTKPDGTGQAYGDEEKIKNLTAVDGDTVKLYVQWEPNEYIVKFDSNKGTGVMDNQTHIYDSWLELSENKFTREGYTFIGWAIHPEDTVPKFIDKESIINLVTGNETILYAVWREHTYTISFNGNGFTSGEMPEVLSATYSQEIKLPKNRYSKIGHDFWGWAKKPSATSEDIEAEDEGIVSKLTAIDNGHVVLYVVWDQKFYNITFKNVENGEDRTLSVPGGTIPDWPRTPYINPNEEKHYIFIGWNRTFLVADRHTEYEALYMTGDHSYTIKEITDPVGKIQGYTTHKCDVCGRSYTDTFRWRVIFKDEWDNVLSDKKLADGIRVQPPASYENKEQEKDTVGEDWYFDGWYDEENGKWAAGKTADTNLTYKAAYDFKVKQYPVKWYDGNGILVDSQIVDYNSEIPTTDKYPTKNTDAEYSYVFDGTWKYTGDIEDGRVLGPVECFANFIKTDKTYKITWKNSDGTVLFEQDGLKYKDTPPIYPNGKPEHPKTDELEGLKYRYDFIGWKREDQNTFYPEEEDLPIVTTSVTYVAVYKKVIILYNIKVQVYRVDYPVWLVYEDLVYGTTLNLDGYYYGYTRGHKFSQWNDGVTSIKRTIKVTGNDEYVAEYSLNKYTVKWLNYNNEILDEEELPYRTIPNHKKVETSHDFSRPFSEKYHYSFDGNWSVVSGTVTSDGEIMTNVVYKTIYTEREHEWTEPNFEFNIQNNYASARRDCTVCGHFEISTVKLIKQILPNEQATCDKPGKISYLAYFYDSWNKLDGPRIVKYDIPALGHLWSSAKKIGDDGQYGYHYIVCRRCNEATIETHKWSAGRPNVVGACVYGGTIKRQCTVPGCTAVYYEEVVPGKHGSFIETGEKIPTCETDGHTGYKQCTICKLYFDINADENYAYGDRTTKSFRLPALGHNYNKEEILQKASCYQEGSGKFICANSCGIDRFFVIPQRQHKWKVIEPINKTEIPCKDSYEIEYECLNEENKYYVDCEGIRTEEALDPHTPVTIKGTPPTCTETGEADEVRCDVCDKILVKKYELPPLGHHLVSKNLVPAENTLRREIMNSCVRKGCDYKIHLYYSD